MKRKIIITMKNTRRLTTFCLTGALTLAASGGALASGNDAALQALFAQANYWHEKSHDELAMESLQKVLSVDANNTQALYLMALWSQQGGDMQAAAEIADKVFYCNAAPMLAAYLLCDVLLTAVMLVLIWKGLLPLKSTARRILASLCNPIAFAGIVGNLFTLLPWPLNQLDHGTESAGHLLVLALGLALLREMAKSGELKEAAE